MKREGSFNLAHQRPNSKNSMLFGTQYMMDEASYLEFCRMLADNEEPREYVCPAREDSEIEKAGIIVNRKPRPDSLSEEKPAESYAYMIYKALESSPDGKLTLADIYSWIEKTYPFYRTADPVWKNSIRHNLSLNTAFKKIPRPESSKGKGGYWAIDHESQKNGKALKRKRNYKVYESVPAVSNILNEKSGKLIF